METNSNNKEQMQGQTSEQSNSSTSTKLSDGDKGTALAVISYIGPLVIVSYLMAKENDFVKFHARQGLTVFAIEVIVMFLGSMMYSFWMIINILNLLTLILSVIGIVNAVSGNKKELPVIGGFAKNWNF